MPHPTAIFRQIPGEAFGSYDAAIAALEGAGFSTGEMDRGAPIGILLGEATIAKWHSMSPREQSDMHGQLWTSRDGATTVMLHNDAPLAAVTAFEHVLACSDAAGAVMPMGKMLGQASLLCLPVLALLSLSLMVMP